MRINRFLLFLAIFLNTPLDAFSDTKARAAAIEVKKNIQDSIESNSAEERLRKLISAKTLKCFFSEGYSIIEQNGEVAFKKGDFSKEPVIIDSIDIENRKARMIGNAGSNDLMVIALPTGISFIEISPLATTHLTTVFTLPGSNTDEFIAVASRHTVLPQAAIPSQYAGRCTVWGE